jgi:Acetyltransferase (GNAT) family
MKTEMGQRPRGCGAQAAVQLVLPWLEGVSGAAMRDRFVRELASGWSAHVACNGTGGLVGFLALKPDTRCLGRIFVALSAQGQGGLALPDFAKQQMPGGIWLRTAAENGRAYHFYERSGF